MFLAYGSGIKKIVSSALCCLILLLLTAAAVDPIQAHAAPDAKVLITGKEHPFGFLPAMLSVYVNQRIVFINTAVPAASYRVIAKNHAFASSDIAPGQQWTLQIGTPGLYEYNDPSFQQQMVGELNVVPLSTKLIPPSDPAADATAIAELKTRQGSQAPPPATPPFFLAGIFVAVLIVLSGMLLWARQAKGKQLGRYKERKG